jgi:leucine dehydrogenase
MGVFECSAFAGHERVTFCHDPATGLRAIFAIHSTVLGPALGGVRMFPYEDSDAALRDVLRLSEAMTLKSAFAGLPLGGGKSVLWGNPREKCEPLLRAYGRAVDALGGSYYCAEDVGTRPEDMEVIALETPFVTGRPSRSGDTCPATALGVFQAMRAALRSELGRDGFAGARIAIQGYGGVGRSLALRLREAGAELWVADVSQRATDRARAECGAAVVSPDRLVELEVDVFAPCALGGILDAGCIEVLRARIVCGAANNQLATEADAARLAERGILYVPDFVANAGGLVSAASELTGDTPERVHERVSEIYERCLDLLGHAQATGLLPMDIARQRVDEILEKARSADSVLPLAAVR